MVNIYINVLGVIQIIIRSSTLEPLIEDNRILKNKIEILEKKIEYLEKEKKLNNILFFGLEESEGSSSLLQRVQKIFKDEFKITLEANYVSKINRFGRNKENKLRPVLISFTSHWKRNEVLKLKKSLKNGYVTEDFLEKRELKTKLIEERAKGNTAYFKYDQLVVKEGNQNKEKRKRDYLTSPENEKQAKKSVVQNSAAKENNNIDITKPLQEKYDILEKELVNLKKSSAKKEKQHKLGKETLNLTEERNKMLDNRKDNKQNIESISKQIQTSKRKHRKIERLNVLREYIEKTGGIKKGLKHLSQYTLWIPNMKSKNLANSVKCRQVITTVSTDNRVPEALECTWPFNLPTVLATRLLRLMRINMILKLMRFFQIDE
ncbi:unnamed protein product [Leptidea sinapis]|uniref:Endonuclease-reverse transcriptase n=1 Tax=Leptidea sinapis TaxID=189913 RepID=A0A5E4QHE9_9NEOP|nr:unnamed protein product [Leptidea sinapis]